MKLRNLTIEIIAALFIILWVPAGASKLYGFEKFRFQLGRSPYVEDIATFVAAFLPTIEILLAIALVFKTTRPIGMYMSFLLMLVFTGYLYMMLHYSYFVPCSCGGIIALFGLDDNWPNHLKFNVVFTCLAGIGILLLSNVSQFSTLPATADPVNH